MPEPTSTLSIPDKAAGVKNAGFWHSQSLASPLTAPQPFVVLQRTGKHWEKKPNRQKKPNQTKTKSLWVNAKLFPCWRKESQVLCYKLGSGPKMLLGFSARLRAEPRAAGSCFPLSACPWEMLLGLSARVRAEPRAAGACFLLPLVLGK